jgi:hypothetical protein
MLYKFQFWWKNAVQRQEESILRLPENFGMVKSPGRGFVANSPACCNGYKSFFSIKLRG